MTKALALLILAAVLVGLTVLACIENRPNGLAAPLLMDAAWGLNTRCAVNSRNLPRHIERIA